MASIVEKTGRTKLWMKIREGGGWKLRPTPYTRDQRRDALRYAKRTQDGIDKREANGQSAKLTLRNYFKQWLETRKAADVDWKHDESRMRLHVLPIIGDKLVTEVRPQNIIEVAQRLRRNVAQRTVYNTYSVMSALFRDAVLAGIIEQTPCILDERHLGPKVDKDPEWRNSAVYDRDEVTQLISEHEGITWDQRVHYGIAFLAGLRHGEVSALKWRHWDVTATPLGRLFVSTSYSTEKRRTKGTKTETVRYLPVHPVLASILTEWRATGWAQMMGREPTEDDLILPLPPEHQKRRLKQRDNPNRDSDYSYKRWQADLAMLGFRPRRAHDARATFVTLTLDDGADPGVIERLTHPPKSRSAFNLYNRGKQWNIACAEVAKLTISRRGLGTALGTADAVLVGEMLCERGDSKTDKEAFGFSQVQGRRRETAKGHEPSTTEKDNAGTTAWYREPTALEIALGSVIADALIEAVLADDTTKAKVLAKVIYDARKRAFMSQDLEHVVEFRGR